MKKERDTKFLNELLDPKPKIKAREEDRRPSRNLMDDLSKQMKSKIDSTPNIPDIKIEKPEKIEEELKNF